LRCGRERACGGRTSEFFRAEHGDDEVDEGGEGDQADEKVFHGGAAVRGKVRRERDETLRTQRTFWQK
jgi:hypothetical protein